MSGIDMHPDLEWLARNVSEWPPGANDVRIDRDGEVCFTGGIADDAAFDFYPEANNGAYFVPENGSKHDRTGVLRTYSQWLQARKDLGLIMRDEEEEIPAPEWAGSVPEGVVTHDDTIKTSIKQLRYMDAKGEDWIDEFAHTASVDEFRGAMKFTIGKYNRRAGKKDELVKEIEKMRDYCDRWIEYERSL